MPIEAPALLIAVRGASVLLSALCIGLAPWTLRHARHNEPRALAGIWAAITALGGCTIVTMFGLLLTLARVTQMCGHPGTIASWSCRLCLIPGLAMLASLLSFLVSFVAWPPWRPPFKAQLVRLLHLVLFCLTPFLVFVFCGD